MNRLLLVVGLVLQLVWIQPVAGVDLRNDLVIGSPWKGTWSLANPFASDIDPFFGVEGGVHQGAGAEGLARVFRVHLARGAVAPGPVVLGSVLVFRRAVQGLVVLVVPI